MRDFGPFIEPPSPGILKGMPTAARPVHLGTRPRDPWFSQRPCLALGVIAAMFVAVLALRLLAGNAVDAYSMLYVLPVALAASAFGQRGGVTAGLIAVALIVAWVLVRDVSLGPTGWGSRVVPIVLLGVLLGKATDRVRRAETERRRLEQAALLHREAIEINDSLIQGMTAAKWSLESGESESGLEILTATVHKGHQLVSGLIRRANMGGSTEPAPTPANPTTSPRQPAHHSHPEPSLAIDDPNVRTSRDAS